MNISERCPECQEPLEFERTYGEYGFVKCVKCDYHRSAKLPVGGGQEHTANPIPGFSALIPGIGGGK
jgi:hypothetical protein